MDAQTGPQRPKPNPYDIGAFLSGGLNMDEDQARNMILSLRSRMAAADLERDRDDVAEIEFDILCDIVDMAERLLDIWRGDDHTLVMHEEGGWSIEHSLRCRATGSMATCPHHQMMDITGYDFDPGRYPMVLDGGYLTLGPKEPS